MALTTDALRDFLSTLDPYAALPPETRAELVVPVIRDGRVVAVIDLDSPHAARFDEEDRAGIERLAALVAQRI